MWNVYTLTLLHSELWEGRIYVKEMNTFVRAIEKKSTSAYSASFEWSTIKNK